MSRLVLHCTCLAALAALLSAPDALRAAPDKDTGDAQHVRELLDTVASADSSEARLQAAARAAELDAGAAPAIVEFLERPRRTADAERRAVLEAIHADVPDEEGRFRRRRDREVEVRTGDDFDWLAELAALDPAPPGAGEVMADVAAIRALAASEDIEAGASILAFAFSEVGLVYRDECGRYLRRMAPYSLPSLIEASESRENRAMARYAGYQLERMDRKSPAKAIDHASMDEELEVAVLEAYRKTKPREGVAPILAATDDPSPRVRAAARAAWMSYVTGPEPPPAPKRRLKLPGGKLSEEPEPLWLTYRELADIEIRRIHEEVFGERAPRRASLQELSRKLFAHYDGLRADALAARYDAARKLAEAGDWQGAAAAHDRILAEAPDHPERAAMAAAYLEHGKALERAEAWRDAAAAYSKAHGLAPDGAHASAALAGHHFTLGKALEAEGKDGTAAFQRAAAIDPGRADEAEDAAETSVVLGRAGAASKQRWMLYAGVAGCASALILFILGLAVRRR